MELRFAYATRVGTFVMSVLLGLAFVIGGAWCIWDGWGISFYTVEVDPDTARWFYGFFILLGVVLLVMGIVSRAAGAREVVITPDLVTVPKGEYSRRVVTIDPREIRKTSMQTYNGIHTFRISHPRGTVRLRSPHFASLDDFVACTDAIDSLRTIEHPHA